MLGPERPRPILELTPSLQNTGYCFVEMTGEYGTPRHEGELPRFFDEAKPPAHRVDRAAI